MQTMTAAILDSAPGGLHIEEIPVPEPLAGEVLVQGERVRRVPHRPARDEGGSRVPDAGGHGPRNFRHGGGARPRRRRAAGRHARSCRRSSCRAGSARRAAPDATISATASSR